MDKWSAGHKGKLEFVVPEDKNGWEILLTFDKPCKRLEVSNWLTIDEGVGSMTMSLFGMEFVN